MENDAYSGLNADMELAKAYKRLLVELQHELEIPGEIGIEHVIALPDLITMEGNEEKAEETWAVVLHSLENALHELVEMRHREGQELLVDLKKRLELLENNITNIESVAVDRSHTAMDKLRERVSNLMKNKEIDEGRLEQEIALLADRLDITEECVRFHSHNKLFLESLESKEAPGRKLNFLLQEMNREANTIGAKASDAQISHIVVAVKEEIEKIREQVQNIE
jgi:uncharacterized protein (TIGR00255 family)